MNPLTAALQYLPHGPEFRFIDRLTTLDPGESGAGEFTLRGDEPFLRGHFPGNPLMPGVLVVEAAAQLAGIVAQSDPQRAPMAGLKLTALRAVKILGTAKPGETIHIDARLTGRLGKLVQVHATAKIGDQLILQADLTLSGEK